MAQLDTSHDRSPTHTPNSPMFRDSNSSSKKHNSSLTISLATAAICLLNSNQSAIARDLNRSDKPIESDRFSFSHLDFEQAATDSHDSDRDQAVGLLPRVLGFLPISFQAKVANWSQALGHQEFQHSSENRGTGGILVQDLTPLYLSQGRSTSTKRFSKLAVTPIQSSAYKLAANVAEQKLQTYIVKAGDTINRIAKKHQVSREEIIRLNNIKNSNIIFVSQQLKIPVTQLKEQNIKQKTVANLVPNSASTANLPASSTSDRLANTKPNLTDRSFKNSNLEQERVAKLNADIKRMRAEYRQDRENTPRALSPQPRDIQNLPVQNNLASVSPESSQDSDVISATAVSLQLPPLPPSEEYLPKAFDGYDWPAQGVLTSGYGWRWGRLHKGIDIAGPIGTPVFAAASGEVISAGWNSGGYGNLIKLRHMDGSMTIYAHNNKIMVNSGQKVVKGDQIAEMGNTGFSTGSHLHFEIHSREQGVINPLALLK